MLLFDLLFTSVVLCCSLIACSNCKLPFEFEVGTIAWPNYKLLFDLLFTMWSHFWSNCMFQLQVTICIFPGTMFHQNYMAKLHVTIWFTIYWRGLMFCSNFMFQFQVTIWVLRGTRFFRNCMANLHYLLYYLLTWSYFVFQLHVPIASYYLKFAWYHVLLKLYCMTKLHATIWFNIY